MRRILLWWWCDMYVLLRGVVRSAHTLLCCCSQIRLAPLCILVMSMKNLMQWPPELLTVTREHCTLLPPVVQRVTPQTHKGNVCCQSIKLKTIMATKSLLFTFKYYVSKWYLTCVYFWMCGHFQAAVLCLFVCYFVCFLSQKLAPFRFFCALKCNPSHQIQPVAHFSTE